jgi:hypothetical protein
VGAAVLGPVISPPQQLCAIHKSPVDVGIKFGNAYIELVSGRLDRVPTKEENEATPRAWGRRL